MKCLKKIACLFNEDCKSDYTSKKAKKALRSEIIIHNKTRKMKNNQKIFAIVKKDTKEIMLFGLNEKEVKDEWDEYYEGRIGFENLELMQTFIPKNEIPKTEFNFKHLFLGVSLNQTKNNGKKNSNRLANRKVSKP